MFYNIKLPIFLITILSIVVTSARNGPKTYLKADVYVISIGINDYGSFKLDTPLNDAKSILQKIEKDNKNSDTNRNLLHNKMKVEKGIKINNTYTYGLYNENATAENVRNAFHEIIKKSRPHDYFVLFYAGFSLSLEKIEAAFILYQDKEINYENMEANEYISLAELASLLNQISSNNQLIISESCYGNKYAQKLMSNLFENNPLVASNQKRNRIIITVADISYDKSPCDKNHAPLASYILKNNNILKAFYNLKSYEYNLHKSHIDCDWKKEVYFIIRREKDFSNLIINNYNKTQMRGANASEIKTKNNDAKSENFAFLVATNEYNVDSNWNQLKNPINDAEEVSKLLESKYDIQVTKVYNKTKGEVLKSLIEFKKNINKGDKVIFFIAGHGYYSKNLSDGFLVFKNSKSLNDDPYLQTYFSMAKINRLMDGFNSKQIFSIFDVCYGSSFEIYNQDLAIENYNNTEFDNGIEDFIENTDESTARIMLASGEGEVPDFWNNSLDHSPFASKLIKSLEEEDKFISPGRIYSYVRGNTTTPILKKFGKHEVTGDFLLKAK